MKSPLKVLQERAHRWWEWAAGIRAASELESAKPFIISHFPLLDTSEIVEYARPSSKLRDQYPTRLDLSLNLLLAPHRDVYISGPHAREIRGLALGWQEHMKEALLQLKVMRERLQSSELDAVKEDLNRIHEQGVRNAAQELVQLLRKNYRWVFAESRLRPANLFDRLLSRLIIPSATQLGLQAGWRYQPDEESVRTWRRRLDDTGLGKKEPGPNLVDAYALDQLHQVALAVTKDRQSARLPILLTHSGKIFEALRMVRASDPEFFRIHGVSLVQPPQMALVLQLRDDAVKSGRIDEVTEELARQMARGEDIDELLREAARKSSGDAPPVTISYSDLERELDQFEKNWDQWDALRQVHHNVQEKDDAPGMLEGLEAILKDASAADANYLQDLLAQELEELITEVDRLQGEISNRIAPPDAPVRSEFELKGKLKTEIATVLVRFRSTPKVPSAAYPIGSFHFRDPKMIEELARIELALDDVRNTREQSEEKQARLQALWRDLSGTHELLDQPEFFLLLAVLYIAQEKWMQAYDMASQGLLVMGDLVQPAAAELHLARAGAGRAFVHSARMDFPATCMAFLQSAVDDCLKALELQDGNGAKNADGRCLRELAVIYCSAHDPVYGPGSLPLTLRIDRARIRSWVNFEGQDDPLRLAGTLARKAYEQNATDPYAGVLYENTHLYVMTELDRRALDAKAVPPGESPQHERERAKLASSLESKHKDDPNILDTLMWHHRVVAEAQKWRNAPYGEAAKKAFEFARKLEKKKGTVTQYYQQLVNWHLKRVEQPVS